MVEIRGSPNDQEFLARSASIAAIAALAPVAAVYAQETASELRGSIVDLNGAAVAGATVTILHEPTGSASVMSTSSNGGFFQTGLRPGGPYSITVSAPGFEGAAVEGLNLSPGTQPRCACALPPSATTRLCSTRSS